MVACIGKIALQESEDEHESDLSQHSKVRSPTQTEGTVKEIDFVNIPSGSRNELKISGGKNPEIVVSSENETHRKHSQEAESNFALWVFLTEVFEKFGVPIPTFEPYSHYDTIDYYEIKGHHKDIFAEYDIVVEGRTVYLFPLLLLLILHWSGFIRYYALK
ncbi:hypothetical protein HAX54_045371 [Datura stramonium]|uniref:Uncharacterized protein n=1 Tax=Datura stramonium TaxID=4076 RepID=A0ABS8SQM7_DATST|nr:hypothetical protein [Datura stramonium]